MGPIAREDQILCRRGEALRALGAEVDLYAHMQQVTFKCRVRDESIGGDNPFTWKDVTTEDIMKGKRVVIFALPGAFTPTCSSTHLPGYEKVSCPLNFLLSPCALDLSRSDALLS